MNTKPSQKKLVVQHNQLIQASYRLSLQEKRVVLWLSSKVNPKDKDFKNHEAKVIEFCEMTGLKSKNMYEQVVKISKSLMKKVLQIKREDKESTATFSWLSYSEYFHKEGRVIFRFDPALKPYLLELKSSFTKMALEDAMKLKSFYSIRLFEFLSQFKNQEKIYISIKTIRGFLGINNSYKKYGEMKRHVLSPSIKELEEKLKIKIKIIEKKDGKTVSNLIFVKEGTGCDVFVCNRIGGIVFSDKTKKYLVNKYSEEEIKKGISVLEKHKGHIKNPNVFLKKAIEGDWQPFLEKDNSKKQVKKIEVEEKKILSGKEEACFKKLRLFLLNQIGIGEYKSWIEQLKFCFLDNNILILGQSKFVSEYVENKYKLNILKFCETIDHDHIIFQTKTWWDKEKNKKTKFNYIPKQKKESSFIQKAIGLWR